MTEQQHHYYASSIADWRVFEYEQAARTTMEQLGYPFSIWRVELPITAKYSIREYRPDLPGHLLTHTTFIDPCKET